MVENRFSVRRCARLQGQKNTPSLKWITLKLVKWCVFKKICSLSVYFSFMSFDMKLRVVSWIKTEYFYSPVDKVQYSIFILYILYLLYYIYIIYNIICIIYYNIIITYHIIYILYTYIIYIIYMYIYYICIYIYDIYFELRLFDSAEKVSLLGIPTHDLISCLPCIR